MSSIAYSIPYDPNIFYGEALLNGKPADGVLYAVVNGQVVDNISVSSGKFGGPGVGDGKLVVTGKPGDTIQFSLSVDCYDVETISEQFEEGVVEFIRLEFVGKYTCEAPSGGAPANDTLNQTNITNQTINETAEEPPVNLTDEEEEELEIPDFVPNETIEKEIEDEIADALGIEPDKIRDIKVRDITGRVSRKMKGGIVRDVKVEMLEIETDEGEEIRAVRISKVLESNKPVVEIIPKEVAPSSKYIRIIVAQGYEILVDDPVIRIYPDNLRYEYVITRSVEDVNVLSKIQTVETFEVEKKRGMDLLVLAALGIGVAILVRHMKPKPKEKT